MKSRRVFLFEWETAWRDENIDIDWPKVQQHLGRDQVEWLLAQPRSQCQLVVDKINNQFRLVAEFYDDRALVNYHLMWAK